MVGGELRHGGQPSLTAAPHQTLFFFYIFFVLILLLPLLYSLLGLKLPKSLLKRPDLRKGGKKFILSDFFFGFRFKCLKLEAGCDSGSVLGCLVLMTRGLVSCVYETVVSVVICLCCAFEILL